MNVLHYVDNFEKLIYYGLMIMLVGVIIVALLDLGYFLVLSLMTGNPGLLESHEAVVVHEIITVLGAFLLILIGVELLDTIREYFREKTIHVEIVLILAIIAVARSVILLDPAGMTGIEYGVELIGIGVIVIGLGAGYYLIKKVGLKIVPESAKPEK